MVAKWARRSHLSFLARDCWAVIIAITAGTEQSSTKSGIRRKTSRSLEESKEYIRLKLSIDIGPEGSSFLQLQREQVEWTIIGGIPSLDETAHQGMESWDGRDCAGVDGIAWM